MSSPITKLPDGSAFFTADVMSREEAMKLPPEKRPLNYRISSEMYHTVWSCVIMAATCNQNHELVTQAAVGICLKIAEELEKAPNIFPQV